MEMSRVLGFRATNFLIEYFGLKWDSESLQMLSGEMEPCAGRPSWDPAFPSYWKEAWGDKERQTEEEAASAAVRFLEEQGSWGDDDGHDRLTEGLKSYLKEPEGAIALTWRYCVNKAHCYASAGAWSFGD
jgi:hypothetical protein